MDIAPSPEGFPLSPTIASFGTGDDRSVIETARAALAQARSPVLAMVLETLGSTYVGPGAIALFDGDLQAGWLSGGCLEPEIARRAAHAASGGGIDWMEVDTRDDESLFGSSALGCRGRLRLILLPLQGLQGWGALAGNWLDRLGSMDFSVSPEGELHCSVGDASASWTIVAETIPWQTDASATSGWSVRIPAPPSVVVFGTGPEAPILLPMLRSMGWFSIVVERRPRWLAVASLGAHLCKESPQIFLDKFAAPQPFAALVMHHNFELDLEALLAIAGNPPAFIGLLGPRRRRDDLFKLLPESARANLEVRLHSPVGMDLGGRGPAAIALSIAAQLQVKLYGR